MANPTDGPFDKAAPSPERGDPEILPRGTVTRPSRERPQYGPSGELLPEGPPLPANFLQAPDIENLPWTRKRGNEWTDADFRQIVFDFLIAFMAARSWARSWDITERANAIRMTAFRLPPDQHYLVLGVTDTSGQRFETSAPFPRTERDTAGATVILNRMATAIDALQ
jgi:hypothetical protein